MRRMEKVTGRTDDMIILRGVNLFPTQVEELILRTPGLSAHFQLVLTRPERLDELTIRVEAAPRGAAGAGERLAQRVKDTIGVSVAVEVVERGAVERSLGKAQRIVDLR
jgi:phenylacetate-CoA ligase